MSFTQRLTKERRISNYTPHTRPGCRARSSQASDSAALGPDENKLWLEEDFEPSWPEERAPTSDLLVWGDLSLGAPAGSPGVWRAASLSLGFPTGG